MSTNHQTRQTWKFLFLRWILIQVMFFFFFNLFSFFLIQKKPDFSELAYSRTDFRVPSLILGFLSIFIIDLLQGFFSNFSFKSFAQELTVHWKKYTYAFFRGLLIAIIFGLVGWFFDFSILKSSLILNENGWIEVLNLVFKWSLWVIIAFILCIYFFEFDLKIKNQKSIALSFQTVLYSFFLTFFLFFPLRMTPLEAFYSVLFWSPFVYTALEERSPWKSGFVFLGLFFGLQTIFGFSLMGSSAPGLFPLAFNNANPNLNFFASKNQEILLGGILTPIGFLFFVFRKTLALWQQK